MPDANPSPDTATIRAHLAHITRRWHELDTPCVVELVYLTADDKARVQHVARYAPTDTGIDLAAADAAAMNANGVNAYATVNPVRADAQIPAGKRASAEHIAASFFHWADADDEAAANAIRNFVGPRPTFAVITGTEPTPRPHVYWELEEPTLNLTAWSSIQKAIAATLGTDPAVIDPPRIMRLAGTINWPKPKKQAKGYKPELVLLRIHDEDERPPVSSEQMRRAFAGKPEAAPAETDWIDGHESRTASDYADILRRARTEGQKHSGVRDLTASLAGQGVSKALAEAITREACPVWDDNVQELIDSAYEKFYRAPDLPFTEPPSDGWPTPLEDFDEAALPRRQWILGRDYIRNYVSVVASAGGIGKTSNASVEALSIVTGRPLLNVEVHDPCNVWVVNLEDPIAEMRMRVLAAMKHYRISPDDVRGKLFLDGEDTIDLTLAAETRGDVKLNDAMCDALIQKIRERNIGVVIFDPFISTHLVNENSNAAIQAVVALFRRIARETNAAICIVHHTRKGNGEDASIDSVRGAGSLIGAARAARVMNRLSKEQAEKLGIDHTEARLIFRIDDGKANLAPPAERAIYRKMIGVQIDNGEWVGVTVPYDLPDEWQGMTEEVVNAILARIDAGPNGDGEERYTKDARGGSDRWVGRVFEDFRFDEPKSPAQIKSIVRTWMETGLLEEGEYYSKAQRKSRKGLASTGRVGVEHD